jgi:hypothetical protein
LPQGKPRNEALKVYREGRGFLEYALHPLAAEACRACWIGDNFDGFIIQKIASRAFAAVEQYAHGGRPGRFISSKPDSSKCKAAGIILLESGVLWSRLTLMPVFDMRGRSPCLVQPGEVRRLVKRTVNNETLPGTAAPSKCATPKNEERYPRRNQRGPSTIAAASEGMPFAPSSLQSGPAMEKDRV